MFMFGKEYGLIKGGMLRPICHWVKLLPAQSRGIKIPAVFEIQDKKEFLIPLISSGDIVISNSECLEITCGMGSISSKNLTLPHISTSYH
jgi:hypothetical protein